MSQRNFFKIRQNQIISRHRNVENKKNIVVSRGYPMEKDENYKK